VDEAAVRLGISKQTYYNWKELGLDAAKGPTQRKQRITKSAAAVKDGAKDTGS
jgi:hypothetical protein